MARQVFFTSDLHFGHANIIKYCKRLEFLSDVERRMLEEGLDFRPSDESVQRMNVAIRNNINDIVAVDDILWVIGDFCFAPKDRRVEFAKHYLTDIRCRNVKLVGGNHDAPEVSSLFPENYGPLDPCVGTRVYNIVQTVVGKQRIIMCHLPLAVWGGHSKKEWMLYGHCHATAETWLDKIMPHRKSLDVGIDNAKRLLGEYRPFSYKETEDYMLFTSAKNEV